MRLPLPRNKLVMLSLAGAVLASGGAIALASPSFFAPSTATAQTASPFEGLAPSWGEPEHDAHEHEHEDDD